MSGETNLKKLLQTMQPILNEGQFVFCSTPDLSTIPGEEVIMTFKEEEGYTIITSRQVADKLSIKYSFVACWITLSVHSALHAVGLTATFSQALYTAGISCNVVAAFYHDHIFINTADADKAMKVLTNLSK